MKPTAAADSSIVEVKSKVSEEFCRCTTYVYVDQKLVLSIVVYRSSFTSNR